VIARRFGPVTLLAVGALAVASLGGSCGGGSEPLASETCELPGGYTPPVLDRVEIGQVGRDGRFRAFTDREIVPLVTGGQGASMIVANLRLRGTGIGGCVAQRTMLEIPGGTLISSEPAPLRVEPDGAGAWLTGDAYLVYDGAPGQLVRVRAEVAGQTAAVEIWAEELGSIDAAPPIDGPPADCGLCSLDAADAAPDAAADAAPDAPPDA